VEMYLPCGPVAQLGARFHGMEAFESSLLLTDSKALLSLNQALFLYREAVKFASTISHYSVLWAWITALDRFRRIAIVQSDTSISCMQKSLAYVQCHRKHNSVPAAGDD
jgi:hypothetical protein